GRHPEWAGALAGILDEWLIRTDLTPSERAELERQLGRFAHAQPIKELLARRLRDSSGPADAGASALQAMGWSGLKAADVPADWLSALANVLAGDASNAALVPAAVATARTMPLPREKAGDISARLLRIAADAEHAPDLRLSALAAVPGGLVKPD